MGGMLYLVATVLTFLQVSGRESTAANIEEAACEA